MKPWKEYEVDVRAFYPEGEQSNYRKKLIDEINSKPMTFAEREQAKTEINAKVREHMHEIGAPYLAEIAKREAEFWNDCRQELGYEEFLLPPGVSALEYAAYENGHSAGFAEIYGCLVELVELAEKLLANKK